MSSTKDLYKIRINEVDLRARLFRECDAMVAFAVSRGRQVDGPAIELVGILEKKIENRDEIAMPELLRLHKELSVIVEPALPRSIELMQWDGLANPFVHGVAPVRAVRYLMAAALVFLIGFCVIFASGWINSCSITKNLYDLDKPWELILHLLFYFSLAGLGASFSALYEVYGLVSDGCYDPRFGTTYLIRIGLGLIAGLVLAQLISVFFATQTSTALAFSKPIMALLGGFAVQLVYTALQRLVEALESLFRPDLRSQVELQGQELRSKQRAAEASRATAIAAKAPALMAAIRGEDDQEKRASLLDQLMGVFIPGSAPQAATGSGVMSTVDRSLAKVDSSLATVQVLADLLPGERGKRALAFVEGVQTRLNNARDLSRRFGDSRAIGEVTKIFDLITSRQTSPLVGQFLGILKSFGAVLRIGGALTPPVLVIGLLGIGTKLGTRAYERWKARILHAPYNASLIPPEVHNAAGIKAALDLMVKQGVTGTEALRALCDSPDDFTRFGKLALDQDETPFLDAYGSAFGGTAEQLEQGLKNFRLAMLGRTLIDQDELPAQAIADTGTRTPEELFQVIDQLRENNKSAGDLELISMLSERVKNSVVSFDKLKEAVEAAEDMRQREEEPQ